MSHNSAAPQRPRMESSFTRIEVTKKAPADTSVPLGRYLGTWSCLTLTLLVAIGLRAALYWAGPAHDAHLAFETESARYLELAENITAFGNFGIATEVDDQIQLPLAALRSERGELETTNRFGLRPEILRTPGYPLFSATVIRLGGNTQSIIVAQIILSALGLLFVYWIGHHLLESRRVALIAVVLVAFHPADILAANTFLTETLLAFLVLLGLYLVLRSRDRKWIWALLGGISIGFAVLVQPETLLLGPAVAAWLILTKRSRRNVICASIVTVTSLVPATAWMARNHSTNFGFRISSNPSINAFFHTAARIQIKTQGGDVAKDWPVAVHRLFTDLRRQVKSGEDTFAAMRRMTMQKIIADPRLYAQVLAGSAGRFMTDQSFPSLANRLGMKHEPTAALDNLDHGDISTLHQLGSFHITLVAPLIWKAWNLMLTFLAAVGSLVMLGRRQWSAVALLVGVLAYFLLAGQANGMERLRVPVLGMQALIIGTVFARKDDRDLRANHRMGVHRWTAQKRAEDTAWNLPIRQNRTL